MRADFVTPRVTRLSESALAYTHEFALQSYFDSTLLEHALLEQVQGEGIVRSTLNDPQVKVYGFGLHPSSQAPVAIQINRTQIFTLKPGQVFFPCGGPIDGFRYGLPFGWLGGGVVTLLAFQSKEANVAWSDDVELIFHRVRVPIYQPAELAAADKNNARNNWPLRFPWTKAIRGADSIAQKGVPNVSVKPTRMLMRLQGIDPLAAAAPMRMLVQGSEEFSQGSNGEISLTTAPVFEDVRWPTWTNYGASGNLNDALPVLENSGIAMRLAADDGGLACVDIGGATALDGGYVDFVRYGKL